MLEELAIRPILLPPGAAEFEDQSSARSELTPRPPSLGADGSKRSSQESFLIADDPNDAGGVSPYCVQVHVLVG